MTTQPTEGLKPCPFCGDEMQRGIQDWFGHLDTDRCDCPIALEEFPPSDAAIWNTRASQEQPQ